MPATLVKILLLRAGIEPNPGPPGPTFICPVCQKPINDKKQQSIQCNNCQKWCHRRTNKNTNCSQLPKDKKWSPNYICPVCRGNRGGPPPPPPPSPVAREEPAPPTGTPAGGDRGSPPPPPQQPGQTANDNNFKTRILQFNCNGIKNKQTELAKWLHDEKVLIAALQETKLTDKSSPIDIPGYSIERKDRGSNKGGGLAFLIHRSIKYSTANDAFNINDNHTEAQAIRVNNLLIINVYIPPASSCSRDFKPTLTPVLPPEDTLVLGDLNAHDELWFSSISDARGESFADEINSSSLGVINDDSPTRLPTNGQATSSDVSLASMSLIPYINWETKLALNSDHLPILITIKSEIEQTESDNTTFLNFKKANWPDFTNETENQFSKLRPPVNIFKAEKAFRSIINKAAKQHIPSGRIKRIIPEIPTEAARLIDERNKAREENPHSDRIQTLSTEIDSKIRSYKREKWREAVANATCSSKLYKLIKGLNGETKSTDNYSIKFHGKYVSKSAKIANHFNKQYTSIVRHKSTKEARTITKNLKANKVISPMSFTTSQTEAAIKQARASKARGPDNISNLHLKHLGPAAIAYLTSIFNLSLRNSQIPDIWKSSIILPLLKPGKQATESNSYRPVSLLCPAIKVFERLILPALDQHLPVPEVQHGFRKQHSTVTALNDFNQDVCRGFNQRKPAHRTVLLQLDLSKAFDMVSHNKLLKDLNTTTLPPEIKRWYNCYLHGRQSKVQFRNASSKSRNVRAGVPQGAVTSPKLFNFYLARLPPPPPGVKIVQYADDISVYMTAASIDDAVTAINSYVPALLEFLKERELLVSAEKSTVTLFTPNNKEVQTHPQIFVDGTLVKLEREPKLLGVTFDSMHTFSKHAKITAAKGKKKINILKSLAGSSWGQDKNTMITTYKTICRSTLEYAVPIWGPAISQTNWEALQRVQTSALRIATGNLQMAGNEHLHRETKVLPLQDHARLLTKQFVAACHLPGHPGAKHLGRPPEPRLMKSSLLRHENQVTNLFDGAEVTKSAYKSALKELHTQAVSDSLNNLPPNKVINDNPPDIHHSEDKLPRSIRAELSRLRAGYSRKLNSYMSRIDNTISNTCPECQATPHDTNHLFNCPANPTPLEATDLWTRPTEAAQFLRLEDDGTEDGPLQMDRG